MLKVRDSFKDRVPHSVPLQGLEPYDMTKPFVALLKWHNTVFPLVLYSSEVCDRTACHIR